MKTRLLLAFLVAAALYGAPKLIDAHVHHNGDPEFLRRLVAKLDTVDGLAFVLTRPRDMEQVKDAMTRHPGRILGFGDIRLDDPQALQQIDRFHQAGFRGLGEITGPKHRYDDPVYAPIFERAEKYGMIVLMHTGIVNRTNPDQPSDVSSDRMRVATLDNIARRYPKLTIIGAHLGNPDYAWAAEIGRWNPNLVFDMSGSTLIKKQETPAFWKEIFWWSGVVSPHTPKNAPSAFEKIVFGSDVFNGELEEFDRELALYKRMLDANGVSAQAQENIFGGTLWRILERASVPSRAR
jgi:predicted TIM-barrel fold metal-dependent hydrolase